MYTALKNINIIWQNTANQKKKKRIFYAMISYHSVVMNFSMNEYVSRCIGSHKSHTDEVKMHCSQVRLMFVFWK